MDHIWMRVASNLAARVTGPMKFRLVLQPAMAAFFAIRSGWQMPGLASRRTSGASSRILPTASI
jgi:hypothetical protein